MIVYKQYGAYFRNHIVLNGLVKNKNGFMGRFKEFSHFLTFSLNIFIIWELIHLYLEKDFEFN